MDVTMCGSMHEREELAAHWNHVQVDMVDAGYRIELYSRRVHFFAKAACFALMLGTLNMFQLWNSPALTVLSLSLSVGAMMGSSCSYARLRRQHMRMRRLFDDLDSTANRLDELERENARL